MNTFDGFMISGDWSMKDNLILSYKSITAKQDVLRLSAVLATA